MDADHREPDFGWTDEIEMRVRLAFTRDGAGDLAFHLGRFAVDGEAGSEAIHICHYERGSRDPASFHEIAGVRISIPEEMLAVIAGHELFVEPRTLANGMPVSVIWHRPARAFDWNRFTDRCRSAMTDAMLRVAFHRHERMETCDLLDSVCHHSSLVGYDPAPCPPAPLPAGAAGLQPAHAPFAPAVKAAINRSVAVADTQGENAISTLHLLRGFVDALAGTPGDAELDRLGVDRQRVIALTSARSGGSP